MSFGVTLKNILKEKGITAYRIQKELGIAEGTVRGWFRGSVPRGDHLLAVSQYLGVDPRVLMGVKETDTCLAEGLAPYGDPVKYKINKMLDVMDEERKRAVLRYTEEKKLLMEFQRKKKVS